MCFDTCLMCYGVFHALLMHVRPNFDTFYATVVTVTLVRSKTVPHKFHIPLSHSVDKKCGNITNLETSLESLKSAAKSACIYVIYMYEIALFFPMYRSNSHKFNKIREKCCENRINKLMPVYHPYNHHLCPDFAPCKIHAAFRLILIVEKRFLRGFEAHKILHHPTYINT